VVISLFFDFSIAVINDLTTPPPSLGTRVVHVEVVECDVLPNLILLVQSIFGNSRCSLTSRSNSVA
jgi:hypothetical protein